MKAPWCLGLLTVLFVRVALTFANSQAPDRSSQPIRAANLTVLNGAAMARGVRGTVGFHPNGRRNGGH